MMLQDFTTSMSLRHQTIKVTSKKVLMIIGLGSSFLTLSLNMDIEKKIIIKFQKSILFKNLWLLNIWTIRGTLFKVFLPTFNLVLDLLSFIHFNLLQFRNIYRISKLKFCFLNVLVG